MKAIVATASAVALAVALVAFVATFRPSGDAPGDAPGETPDDTVRGPSGFVLHDAPRELPDLRFVGGESNAVALSDFLGRTVVLNLWATWCAPCVEEMPTLDALEAELGGEDFEVVALSIDRGGADLVRAFYERTGVRQLEVYVDPSARATDAVGALGLPTTLLIDARGREIGRLVGPATWDSPAMIGFLGGLRA